MPQNITNLGIDVSNKDMMIVF